MIHFGVVLDALGRKDEIERNPEQRWSVLGALIPMAGSEVLVGNEAESLVLYISKVDVGELNIIETRPRGEGIDG